MMTEQEIIDYLKENRTRGVAFNFMPIEVQCWCKGYRSEGIFHIYEGGAWTDTEIGIRISFYSDKVYCLAEDYKPMPDGLPTFLEKRQEQIFREKIDKFGLFKTLVDAACYEGYALCAKDVCAFFKNTETKQELKND